MANDESHRQCLAVCESCGTLCPVRIDADGTVFSHNPGGCACGNEDFSILTSSEVFDDE